eukprot:gene4661-14859_t
MSSPIAAPAPPKKLATPQAHATNPSTSGDVQADSPLPPPPAYLPAPAPAAINGMLPPIAAAIANPPKKLATPQAHATKPSTSGEVRVDSPTPPLLALQRSHSLRGGSCDSYSFGPPKSGRAGTNTAGATASTRPATEKPANPRWQQSQGQQQGGEKQAGRSAQADASMASQPVHATRSNPGGAKGATSIASQHVHATRSNPGGAKGATSIANQHVHGTRSNLGVAQGKTAIASQHVHATRSNSRGGQGKSNMASQHVHATIVNPAGGHGATAMASGFAHSVSVNPGGAHGATTLGDSATPAMGEAPVEARAAVTHVQEGVSLRGGLGHHVQEGVSQMGGLGQHVLEGVSQRGGLGQHKASPTGAPGVRTFPGPRSGGQAPPKGPAVERQAGAAAPGVNHDKSQQVLPAKLRQQRSSFQFRKCITFEGCQLATQLSSDPRGRRGQISCRSRPQPFPGQLKADIQPCVLALQALDRQELMRRSFYTHWRADESHKYVAGSGVKYVAGSDAQPGETATTVGNSYYHHPTDPQFHCAWVHMSQGIGAAGKLRRTR